MPHCERAKGATPAAVKGSVNQIFGRIVEEVRSVGVSISGIRIPGVGRWGGRIMKGMDYGCLGEMLVWGRAGHGGVDRRGEGEVKENACAGCECSGCECAGHGMCRSASRCCCFLFFLNGGTVVSSFLAGARCNGPQ